MSNWIKKGLPVVNITNPDKILTVDKVVYKSKRVPTGNSNETKMVSRIIGVECGFIDGNGKRVVTLMHSKELVPLSISNKGKLEMYKFISREGDYADY